MEVFGKASTNSISQGALKGAIRDLTNSDVLGEFPRLRGEVGNQERLHCLSHLWMGNTNHAGLAAGHLTQRDHLQLTPSGMELLGRIGVDTDALQSSKRATARSCLDWTERRHHLAGAAGAGLFDALISNLGLRGDDNADQYASPARAGQPWPTISPSPTDRPTSESSANATVTTRVPAQITRYERYPTYHRGTLERHLVSGG